MTSKITISFTTGIPRPQLEFGCYDLLFVASMIARQQATRRIGLPALVQSMGLLVYGENQATKGYLEERDAEQSGDDRFYPDYSKVGEMLPLDATVTRILGRAMERRGPGCISLSLFAAAIVDCDASAKASFEQLVSLE